MSIDVPELADLEQVRVRWRSAVAGVLSKSTRSDPADLGDRARAAAGHADLRRASPIRPLYTAFDELPEPPLPGQWPFVRGGDASARRQVRLEGRRGVPAAGRRLPDDANGAVLAGLADGRQRAADPGRGVRCGARASWRRCSTACTSSMVPVILDAGCRLSRRPPTSCWRWWTEVDDDQRATVSVDLGADPLTAPLSDRRAPAIEDVVAIAATGGGGRRACGRSPSTDPRSTTWAPTRRGSSAATIAAGGGLSAAAARPGCRWGRRCGRSASGSPPTTTSS